MGYDSGVPTMYLPVQRWSKAPFPRRCTKSGAVSKGAGGKGVFSEISGCGLLSQSEAFIEKCIEYKKPFCLLLKSQYWHARKRKPLFLKMPPKWILPLTWRPNFLFNTKKHASPLMDVMWVVWIPNYDYEYNTLYYPLDRPTSEEMKIFKEMK